MTKLLFCLPLLFACHKHSEPPRPAPAPTPAGGSRVTITVNEKGFEPEDVSVPAGKPVTLVFDRTSDETCAKQIVVDTGEGNKITKDLPLNTPVEIAATFPKAGKLGFACGMDMLHGTITVQ